MTAPQARKLLFVFSDTGGGHRSTARAVLEALKDSRGELASVELIDGFAEYARWPLSRVGDIYPQMLRLEGKPWSATFRLSDGPRRARILAHTWWPVMRATAMRMVTQHPADAIVSFHPLFNDALLRALDREGRRVPLIAVVTDLITAHAFWYSPGTACWIVPTEEGRRRALAHGVPLQRTVVTGLPVRSAFARAASEERCAVRRRLRVPESLPLVLLLGGADGVGPLEQLCRVIGHSGVEAQLAVVAGRNRVLQSHIARECLPIPVHVAGFIDNVHEWMRAADLVVTKAGPSSISEALVVGTPLVLSCALPGQEPSNVDYALHAGAAVWAPSPELASAAVTRLLAGDGTQLARMEKRARQAGRPDAARRAAEVVWRVACGARAPYASSQSPALAQKACAVDSLVQNTGGA
jgi:1,2-diacylglycerol 3-beta-galactosyltransferase